MSGHFYIYLGLGIYGGGACLHSLQYTYILYSLLPGRRSPATTCYSARPANAPLRQSTALSALRGPSNDGCGTRKGSLHLSGGPHRGCPLAAFIGTHGMDMAWLTSGWDLIFPYKSGFRILLLVKRVKTRTTTIYTETKINIKMPRNGLRMHLPRAKTT